VRARYYLFVERIKGADRACGVAAATMAHELNSELTVILNCVACVAHALGPDHPARAALVELFHSVQRCAIMSSAVQNFAARHGYAPARASLAVLADR